MKAVRWATAALLGCFFALLLVLGGATQDLSSVNPAAACMGGGGSSPTVAAVAVGRVPAGSIAGYAGQQLTAAAAIMRAGADSGYGVRGQTIGVMTSMGESRLLPLNYGDAAGPNSRGYFQQRDWGPVADELDAYKSAWMFYNGGQHGEPGAKSIPGWESMTPTAAAHAVQRNQDPYYYTKYWNAAVAVVAAVSGTPVDVTPGTGNQVCTNQPVGSTPVLASGGWTRPVTSAPITSGFGPRWGTFHYGLDFGAPCGTPTYAAHAGVVVLVAKNNAPPATGYGTLVGVDVGGGIVIRYAHAFNQDVLVTVGQQVKAGDQLTRVGTYGDSTGCHLHFEVQQNGKLVDPAPFLTGVGIKL